MKYALHGPMLSGKSTLARLLADQHGYTWLNYTDYGKELCARALSALLSRPVYQPEVIARKNEWRDFIIQALRIYGFDQGNGVEDLLFEAGNVPDLVFDNVRYQSQWELLRRQGFTLVRLVISQDEQLFRAARAGIPTETVIRLWSESSEQALPPQDEEVVLCVDDKGPEQLAEQLLGLAALLGE